MGMMEESIIIYTIGKITVSIMVGAVVVAGCMAAVINGMLIGIKLRKIWDKKKAGARE